MPPRKTTQSPSAARDDPPKKKAKHSHSPSTSATAATPEGTTLDSYLTADEKSFLSKQLTQLKKSPTDGASSSPDLSSSTWTSVLLPTVATITEKVLKAAAEQYTLAAAASGALAIDEEQAASAQANPAGTPQQFAEENDYLLDQLRQLQWTPFTYERLLEILADPCTTCHCVRASPVGKSTWRGDVLQASLRRCILVNYPLSGDTERSA